MIYMYSLVILVILSFNLPLVFTQNISNYLPEQNTKINNFYVYLPYILYNISIFLLILFSILLKKILTNFSITVFSYIISLYQLLFLIFYTIIWLFFGIYILLFTNKNELLYYQGIWLILNLISLIYPINRNSIWLILFGFSYENIKHVHIYLSILCIISVIIKVTSILLFYEYSYLFYMFDEKSNISPLAGTLSSFSIILTTIFSMPVIRKKIFELFYYSHKILFLIIIILTSAHSLITLIYLLHIIILYLIDIIIRIKNTKKAKILDLKIFGSEKSTQYILLKLQINKNSNLYPGTYFFINYKNISQLEWHPLSYIQNSKNCLTFYIKKIAKNSWTYKINKNDISSEIIIQGPYGKLYNPNLIKKYKHLLFFAGGIGITPLLSIIKDLNFKIKHGLYKNIESINVLWSLSNLCLIECYDMIIQELDKNIIKLEIYYLDIDIIESGIKDKYNIKLKKLNIDKKMSNLFKKIKNKETLVFCSGNKNLLYDVRKICSQKKILCLYEDF